MLSISGSSRSSLQDIGLVTNENGSISIDKEALRDAVVPERDQNTFETLSQFRDSIGKEAENILTSVVAKRFGVEMTIAEVENIEYIRLAEEMGVDAVINKKLITAGKIFKMTLSNKVRFIKYMSGTEAEILEYIVAPDSQITKCALKDIDFPTDPIIGRVKR